MLIEDKGGEGNSLPGIYEIDKQYFKLTRCVLNVYNKLEFQQYSIIVGRKPIVVFYLHIKVHRRQFDISNNLDDVHNNL